MRLLPYILAMAACSEIRDADFDTGGRTDGDFDIELCTVQADLSLVQLSRTDDQVDVAITHDCELPTGFSLQVDDPAGAFDLDPAADEPVERDVPHVLTVSMAELPPGTYEAQVRVSALAFEASTSIELIGTIAGE